MLQTTETALQRYYALADILAERQLSKEEKEELGAFEREVIPSLRANYEEMLTPHRMNLLKEHPHSFNEAETGTSDPFSMTRALYELKFVSRNIGKHLEEIMKWRSKPRTEEAEGLLTGLAEHAELEKYLLQDMVLDTVGAFNALHNTNGTFNEILGKQGSLNLSDEDGDLAMTYLERCIAEYGKIADQIELNINFTALKAERQDLVREQHKLDEKIDVIDRERKGAVDAIKTFATAAWYNDKELLPYLIVLGNKMNEMDAPGMLDVMSRVSELKGAYAKQLRGFKRFFDERLKEMDPKTIIDGLKGKIDAYIQETYVPLDEKQRELLVHFQEFVDEKAEPRDNEINFVYVAGALKLEKMLKSRGYHAGLNNSKLLTEKEEREIYAKTGVLLLSDFEKEYVFKAIVSNPNYERFMKLMENTTKKLERYHKAVDATRADVGSAPGQNILAGDKVDGKYIVKEVIERKTLKEAREAHETAQDAVDEALDGIMESELGEDWQKNIPRMFPFMYLTMTRTPEEIRQDPRIDVAAMLGINSEQAEELYAAHGPKAIEEVSAETPRTPRTSYLGSLGRLSDRVIGFFGGKTQFDE